MRALAITVLIGLGLGALFTAFPGIDLYVSSLFYSDSNALGFVFRGRPLAIFFSGLTQLFGTTLPAALIVGLGLTLICKGAVLGLRRRHYVYLILVLGVGPVLVANLLLKENWGRARPKQVVEFGGTKAFTPALVIADQCGHNCSFVSGDASLAFAMVAFALLARRRKRLYVGAALGLGGLTGLSRIAQGAHFLSDVLFAGVLMILVALILKWLIVDGAWRPLLAWGPSRRP